VRRIVVLMYHALVDGPDEWQALDPAERPYALGVDAFAAQLQALAGAGVPVLDPAEAFGPASAATRGGVVLSFDDGHRSLLTHALPLLRARGLGALGFVTTDFIDQRPGYCRWPDVRALAAQGIRIGAHGVSHRFIADLGDAEAAHEFQHARQRIQDEIGRPVTDWSFPGGRVRPAQLALARQAGYAGLFGSAPGSLALAPRETFGAAAAKPVLLPRIAVRPGWTLPHFMALARAEPSAVLALQGVAGVKRLVRGALGHQRYQRLYERLAA
jgi:peptidoglycan/xylan/chitin deacetylase (PgdA/CDA1 family)